MNEIWNIIEPYITYALAFLTSAGGAAIIGNLIAKRTVNRFDVGQISRSVAEKLANSSIKIDLKAVTEKQLDKIAKEARQQAEETAEKLNVIMNSLADVIACIKTSAKLKDGEVERLLHDLEGIKSHCAPVEHKDEIVLELTESAREDKAEDGKTSAEGLINFGSFAG